MTLGSYDIYCGPAPVPTTVLSQWNFDPFLLSGLAIVTLFAFGRRLDRGSRTAVLTGLLLLLVAFVSPLCALASALFSARVFHHLLLVAVAAPCFALALPKIGRAPHIAFAAHTLLFWIWHSPSAYAFALGSHAAYWLMQISLLGSAIWLWAAALGPRTSTGNALALLFGTVLQMGMLAALLTFSRNPLFDAHFETTAVFGLTPLEDQQLAGVLMWVPAALPYLAAALWRIRDVLSEHASDHRQPP